MPKETAKTRERKMRPTAVNILWKEILLVSVSGLIDSSRAQEVMETMLAKIANTEAKVIIVDILGVATVDSAVANHLIKITKATKLMGCQAILTGISPEISQILVNLGIELKDVFTKSTLALGLEIAFNIVNLEVRPVKAG